MIDKSRRYCYRCPHMWQDLHGWLCNRVGSKPEPIIEYVYIRCVVAGPDLFMLLDDLDYWTER